MEFFIIKDGSQQGPFTLEELADVGVSSETLVWREGMEQWTPAWKVPEMKDILSGNHNAKPTPPPLPQQGAVDAEAGEERARTVEAAPADRRRSRAVVWLAVAAVAFFILLMTCPGADKHREAVSREVSEAVASASDELDTGNAALDMLGGMFGSVITTQIVDAMVGQMVSVDDYFIFSIGKLHYGAEEKTVSFGILGHVFTFDSADLRKAIETDKPLPDTMAV